MSGRYITAEELDITMPGFIANLEQLGVGISNNAGALMVNGYLGDIFDALYAQSAGDWE